MTTINGKNNTIIKQTTPSIVDHLQTVKTEDTRTNE